MLYIFDTVEYYDTISTSDIYAWEQRVVPDFFLSRMPVSRPGCPCEIFGGQIAIGNGFSPSTTDFPCQL